MIEKALINNKAKLITQEHLSIIKNLDDKIETLLFLPEGEDRKGEGGLRTKGYFKHNYKMNKEDNLWYICDTNKNFIKPAPENIQKKIKVYVDYINNNSQFENKTLKNITELPLITVITVVLNGEKYLEQTIQSVINQTYPNVEYIIIDGGSTDGTLDIIKKYEDKIDYWVSEKDKGIYDAMNRGITTATGLYVLILNSDDYFYTNTSLQGVIIHLNQISEFPDIVYGDGCVFDEIRKVKYIISPKSINVLKYAMAFNHSSSLVKLKTYRTIGSYSLEFPITSDHDFFLRVYMNNGPESFYYVSYTISTFRVHQGSTSYKSALKGIFENYVIAKKNGVNKYLATIVWFLRMANYLIKSRISFLKKFSFSYKVGKIEKVNIEKSKADVIGAKVLLFIILWFYMKF